MQVNLFASFIYIVMDALTKCVMYFVNDGVLFGLLPLVVTEKQKNRR